MMNYYLSVWKKYAVFSGRASRAEYWYFTLVNVLINGIMELVRHFITSAAVSLSYLVLIYALAVLVPTLAVSVRRLHDTDRSGWWLFIGLIPLIGALVLIYFYIEDGTPGANEYGPNPKGSPTVSPEPATV